MNQTQMNQTQMNLNRCSPPSKMPATVLGGTVMTRLEQLAEFARVNPRDPFPRYGFALELKGQGRLEESADAFAALATDFPDYCPAYLHAGNVLVALHRSDEAASVYRAGIVAATKSRDNHARGELESALAELAVAE